MIERVGSERIIKKNSIYLDVVWKCLLIWVNLIDIFQVLWVYVYVCVMYTYIYKIIIKFVMSEGQFRYSCEIISLKLYSWLMFQFGMLGWKVAGFFMCCTECKYGVFVMCRYWGYRSDLKYGFCFGEVFSVVGEQKVISFFGVMLVENGGQNVVRGFYY